MNRTDLDHRRARFRGPLVVAAVPSIPTQPREGPFHHVASRLLHEPDTPQWPIDHFDYVTGLGPYQPVGEVMVAVFPVGPDTPQSGLVFGRQLPQDLGG